MINPDQFLKNVIRPVLRDMAQVNPKLHSVAAEILLLGTALVESDLSYIKQLENGPAEGFYQMEPATTDDIWDNYLRYKKPLRQNVGMWMIPENKIDRRDQMDGNVFYATAIARVHYWRVSEPMPNEKDIMGLARYYKKHYNTHLGKSTVEGSLHKFALAADIVYSNMV